MAWEWYNLWEWYIMCLLKKTAIKQINKSNFTCKHPDDWSVCAVKINDTKLISIKDKGFCFYWLNAYLQLDDVNAHLIVVSTYLQLDDVNAHLIVVSTFYI